MITLKIPATDQSPCGIHFAVQNGQLNVQPRSFENTLKLAKAHGGSIFEAGRIFKKLETGQAVVLLRGKQTTIPSNSPVVKVLLDNRERLESLGMIVTESESVLDAIVDDPDFAVDHNTIKSALAA